MIVKFEKLFESLPRQSTVDQLKRIRKEIKKHQRMKSGPKNFIDGGDIGDKRDCGAVICDIVGGDSNPGGLPSGLVWVVVV